MSAQLEKIKQFGGSLWDYYVAGSKNYFFPKTDLVLDRITFNPGAKAPPKLNWPAGFAPTAAAAPKGQRGLPKVDVVVFTWTAAEGQALADVLSPGIQSSDWVYYTTNFAAYEKQLTGRSPARESKRLGSWCVVTIGPSKVLLFKSELHPATDGPTLPTAQMVTQVVRECNAGYVITTGTAGGAGNATELGDVNVAAEIHADFTTKLKGKPWSNMSWPCANLTPTQQQFLEQVAGVLPAVPGYPVNRSDLMDAANDKPTLWYGDVVSTDFFAFDTANDAYHLREYDSAIRAVEMDDAAVAIGAGAAKVAVVSVRNASDPVMPDASKASSKLAAQIYQKYGYYTTVNSAVAVWAVIAGLPGETFNAPPCYSA